MAVETTAEATEGCKAQRFDRNQDGRESTGDRGNGQWFCPRKLVQQK